MKLHSRAKGLSRIAALYGWGPRAGSFFFIVAAACLFAFSALNPGGLQGVRMRTVDLFVPVLAAVNKPVQDVADYVRMVSGIAHLQEENAKLRSENMRLREWYQTALLLQNENKSLKALMNVVPEMSGSFVTARVIADSGNAYVKSLLVMAGAEQAIDKGHPVLAGDGLIGRVIETGRRTARVLLMTDVNSRIPVQIEGAGYRAILAGNNDDAPMLLHLPPDSEIKQGARVITSGHGGLFPFGLPVGEVAVNEKGKAFVRPYVDIDRVVFVRVLDKVDNPRLKEGKL